VDRLPNVFDELSRSPRAGSPPASTPVDPAVLATVERSIVKVAGPACGRVQAGSGSVVGPDLVVTNAHVVAGMSKVSVETLDGVDRPGTVVAFDPRNDLALVSLPGLDRPALPIRAGRDGDVGAALGFPGGGNLKVSPFRIDRHLDASGRDIYGEERVERNLLVLAADLEPGDSGGALVAPDGALVGVAFAIAPDQPGTAYGIRTDELASLLAATPGREPVSVGACTG
jgi:S1-C subfamily serine protease